MEKNSNDQTEYIKKLEFTILDLLAIDGMDIRSIQRLTGLNTIKCAEIYKTYYNLCKKHLNSKDTK